METLMGSMKRVSLKDQRIAHLEKEYARVAKLANQHLRTIQDQALTIQQMRVTCEINERRKY